LFLAGSLSQLVPEDYILKKVDRVLDLSWLRDEVRDLYCDENGRPSEDPESIVRLMLAGFFLGIIQDRRLVREAGMHVGIRWFAGYELHDALPDHSTLSVFRKRLGADLFKKMFLRVVRECARAGLVGGSVVHVDATLIRADVSWESMTTEYAEKTLSENDDEGDDAPKHRKKRSTTDPDCSLATQRNDHPMEPTFKQHTAVDDKAGVIVDVSVTTGETSEGREFEKVLARVEEATGRAPEVVTADSGYAHSLNYALLESRGIDAVIPPQPEMTRSARIPHRRFRYDERAGVVRCPAGKILTRSTEQANGVLYRARRADCRCCPLRSRCLPPTASARTILIVNGYPALLRARRRRRRWGEREYGYYARHRWMVEGAHADAKQKHGLHRAVRRGLGNVAIQVYLTAMAMNLKRLAKAVFGGNRPRTGPQTLLRALRRTSERITARVFEIYRHATAAPPASPCAA
jgi:IS5 family transposase